MSRFTRRTLAAVLGLSLGWFAAGLLSPTVHAEAEPAKSEAAAPAVAPAAEPKAAPEAKAAAKEVAAHSHAHAESASAPESASAGASAEHNLKALQEESDEGVVAASKLVPGDPEDVSWFNPVLGIAFGLFVAALTLGWFASVAKGPPPVEPADDDHSHAAPAAHDAGHGHSH